MEYKVVAILPAGGSGSRVGIETPKQFCKIAGKPLISYTIDAFEKFDWISTIAVLVAAEYVKWMESMLTEYNHSKVVILHAEGTRHRTIKSGVKFCMRMNTPPEIVIIHDAVRLFVDDKTMLDVSHAAWKYGSAGVVCPLVSTVVAVDSFGFLDHALERSKYRASEMPQAFKLHIIEKAYNACGDFDLDFGTECLHLVDQYTGTKAHLTEGNTHLWKVTHKRDLYAAEGLIKENMQSNIITIGFEDNPTLEKAIISFHECKTVKDNCLNFVIYYHQWNLTKPSNTDRCLNVDNSITCSKAIHIIKTENAENDFFAIRNCFQTSINSTNNKNISEMQVAVMINESTCISDLLSLLKSLVSDNNSACTGQVLIV